jgi:o-succinylbenzoate synthase
MVKKIYQYGQKLLVEIDDCWGEISPLPGFSKETFEEAKKEAIEVLRDNKPPTLASVIWGFSVSPLTAVKVPLCAFNRPRDGCSTLKLKVGHLTLLDAVQLVKQYVGKYRLRIDCNRKWTLQQALAFTSHFQSQDFEYLEEPTSDILEFTKQSDFPVALDESFRENQTIPNARCAVIKPTLSGGIPKTTLPIVLSSSYESSLGILQIARLGSPEIAHGLDTFSPDLMNPAITVENGYLTWIPSKNPIHLNKLCRVL